ncbi:GIY-YIG nuclease family protein [Marinoscillum sp. MHG1-6]|uniref:GIY-YIG nuclease family protein n=1 Tax=Marinoscillum sp. MHG1-6 TaxID=2959627 RepID=UPI00215873B4|nr:GIY-YIG nuclease family protein [Marinoscillum sp. MHG1-6]
MHVRGGFVYILTNYNHTTLYTGVTSDLLSRIEEHRSHKFPKSFTAKYKVTKLVYFETFHSIEEAIIREKQIKAGSRKKKQDLICSTNWDWIDLYDQVKRW